LEYGQDDVSDGEGNLHLSPQDAKRFQSSQLGLLRVMIIEGLCCSSVS